MTFAKKKIRILSTKTTNKHVPIAMAAICITIVQALDAANIILSYIAIPGFTPYFISIH